MSANFVASLPFDGMAIGGPRTKPRRKMYCLLEWLGPLVHQIEDGAGRRPLHLLGIADAVSAKKAVSCGVDTMDSCYPTRVARHGQLMLLPRENEDPGVLRIRKTKYARDFRPLDPGRPLSAGCECSWSYLHHLFKLMNRSL